MRNKHRNRILSRTTANRLQLLRNLTSSLLEHGSIVTTEAKAKELRKHFEPLVTQAKQETTLHVRRLLTSQLLQKGDFERLMTVAKANKKRAGGYLRLTRLPVRQSDAASLMRVDLVDKA